MLEALTKITLKKKAYMALYTSVNKTGTTKKSYTCMYTKITLY